MNALVMNCSPVRTGATAEIVRIVAEQLAINYETKTVCVADYDFRFCRGCRTCHDTARCVLQDDVTLFMEDLEWADVAVFVAPSYWADIPGQFKALIDRCTPWCNTHEPHATIRGGKRAYGIALRTGPGMRECERILESIEHFCGHLEIARCGRLGLCSVAGKEDVAAREAEIVAFCEKMMTE